ncbi:alpha/beta hydrolase [Bifidobacterium aerophilum]|uniref:Alpha/beta hydrolase fold domain-containing protein n=1 Tax=Bifidobacterium aerophilum TaxID=1798155 RepID=A0A6N9Z4E2_9BIFI|nr:alpha/beta hydrolase [Bifidobacterium aerophilum]NEG89472.1 alpha/beta hydrolase fold domain-containing protein [Bifidobacterium aerophilum]
MISDEVRQLFNANTKFRHDGDAERLAAERKPDHVTAVMDLPYVDDGHELHRLDVYRPCADGDRPLRLPVILDFHGGGLYHGHKHNTACRDMHLAARGFAVVNANYRLVPEVAFRDQLADALMVVDWLAAHADEYGFDTEHVFITGDSAATLIDLYLCAIMHAPVVADQLRVRPPASGIRIRAIAGVSGMYRFTGGVHGKAMGYYYEGYFPTLKERIAFEPYLDMDRLVVDGDLPPIYMATSAEDYLADNTLEFARILQYRHHDYALRLFAKGLDHPLDHDFSVKETGLPHNDEAMAVVDDIVRFFERYR